MSLLDTVEPDFVWHKPKSGDPDGDIIEEKLYREATVESLLAENRKQVLMEAVEKVSLPIQGDEPAGFAWTRRYIIAILRPMAESTKGEKSE